MKDENIKEILEKYVQHNEVQIILDRLQEIVDEEIIDYGEELSLNECKILLDYITNLQEKIKQYEDPEDLTLFYMWLDEKAKDKLTNLQEENERLKEENKHIFANVNDDQLLRSNAMNYAELQDYKTRNEKAVEYIKEAIENDDYFEDDIATDINEPSYDKYVNSSSLLEILQGKSDE